MTQHILEVNKAYFDAINNGIKTFEIVKIYDREYRIGDTVKFVCVDDSGNLVTIPNYKEDKKVELRCFAVIVYIQTDEDYFDELSEGYGVIGFKKTNY